MNNLVCRDAGEYILVPAGKAYYFMRKDRPKNKKLIVIIDKFINSDIYFFIEQSFADFADLVKEERASVGLLEASRRFFRSAEKTVADGLDPIQRGRPLRLVCPSFLAFFTRELRFWCLFAGLCAPRHNRSSDFLRFTQ